mmetsp:Transcript_14067/g.24642  ORF Transcript_14067/g.24642 Transcript_14067/m.24642 type:complete len:84 (-) Transcript_14067:258-509(-)
MHSLGCQDQPLGHFQKDASLQQEDQAVSSHSIKNGISSSRSNSRNNSNAPGMSTSESSTVATCMQQDNLVTFPSGYSSHREWS